MIDRHDIPQNLPDWARPDGPGLDSALPATGTETGPTGSGSETTVPGYEPVADAATVSRAAPEPVTDLEERKEEMLEALKDVVDPELMVNIVDLGLVYGVDIDAAKIRRGREVAADKDRGRPRTGAIIVVDRHGIDRGVLQAAGHAAAE